MKTFGLYKLIMLALILIIIATGLPACTKTIHAAELKESAYSIKEGKIIISLDKVVELSEIGGWINIRDDRLKEDLPDDLHRSIIIVCTGKEQYLAASKCNKKDWTIIYDHDAGIFTCSKGKRKFDLDGSVIGEKPKQPLNIHSCNFDNGKLIIEYLD